MSVSTHIKEHAILGVKSPGDTLHSDLNDMPDTLGTNTDHDVRNDARYLKLDQTTPQDISGGQPDFLAGLRAGSTNQLSIDASGNLTTTGSIYNKADNSKHYFGAGDDASITYDGTNMLINPKEVGSGYLSVLGNILQADNVTHLFGTGLDMSVSYTGTVGRIDTSLIAASDLQIDCGTAKTIVLDVPVYDDINFSVGRGRVPGANFPEWAAFCGDSNNNAYKFAVGEKIDLGTEEMYHDWKEGTVITPHVHIVLSDTLDEEEKVQFRLYYSIGDTNGLMSAEGYVDGEATIPDETAVRTHILINFNTIDLAAYHIGSMIICQLHRIAKSEGGTELSDEPFVMNVGLHIQKDTMGSRLIASK